MKIFLKITIFCLFMSVANFSQAAYLQEGEDCTKQQNNCSPGLICQFPKNGGATAYCGKGIANVGKVEDGIKCENASECIGGYCVSDSIGNKVCAHSPSKFDKVESSDYTPKPFKYSLLESFPGFFTVKQEMTDLPALILAIYKFGIWTVGIAAMFMITIGGIMYMTSAGNKSTASSAKDIIWDSIYGIIGALSAYLILYVINPDLVKISLDFTPVAVSEAEDVEVSGKMYTSLTTIDGYQIDSSIAASINKIKQNGIKMVVTDGLRSLDKQKELIAKNCGGFPATKSCSPPTCLLKEGPKSCPHTTGRAVDVWALDNKGRQAIMQKDCMQNIQACFNNPYQKALIAAMKKEGFCVLASEPWHFEKSKMSSRCN